MGRESVVAFISVSDTDIMLIFIDMLTSLGRAIGPEGILRLAFFLMLTKTDSSSQLFQNFRDQVGCLILKIQFIKLFIESLFVC